MVKGKGNKKKGKKKAKSIVICFVTLHRVKKE
jgi:hypothetical protein